MKNTYTSEQKRTIIERYISGGETYSQINAAPQLWQNLDLGAAGGATRSGVFFLWLLRTI